jgi:DNA excision repair protein ERCC-4
MENLTLIVDSREQQALQFKNFPSEVRGLRTGDYSLNGFEDVFTVERKSISDLIGSLTAGRDRFFRELDRMQSYQFKRLLIVGTRSDIEAGNYRSNATPKSIIAGLAVIECRHGVPITFCSTPEEAARTVETWAYYFMREKAAQTATGTQGDPEDVQSIAQQDGRDTSDIQATASDGKTEGANQQ